LSLKDVSNISPSFDDVVETVPDDLREEVCSATEIMVKYSRYIDKESDVADRILKYEGLEIPHDIDYRSVSALSFEAREKLSVIQPKTIGQASRISGVSPADVSVLLLLIDGRISAS
jgi:tRNA uridine 5-carboxymethylaminomethyl modification enzyme